MTSFVAADGDLRCGWAGSAPDFLEYHDTEWGFPVADDIRLFEKISLEGFQSGLSWRTILAKRPAFREAFGGFDFHTVAEFGEREVTRLLNDSGIVRHRGKIEAVINNARCAVEMEQREGSLAAFFWAYEANPREVAVPQSVSTSPTSVALSKELKHRGWKFVGPTTAFALMQAMGLINDHTADCITRRAVEAARSGFDAPARASRSHPPRTREIRVSSSIGQLASPGAPGDHVRSPRPTADPKGSWGSCRRADPIRPAHRLHTRSLSGKLSPWPLSLTLRHRPLIWCPTIVGGWTSPRRTVP